MRIADAVFGVADGRKTELMIPSWLCFLMTVGRHAREVADRIPMIQGGYVQRYRCQGCGSFRLMKVRAV